MAPFRYGNWSSPQQAGHHTTIGSCAASHSRVALQPENSPRQTHRSNLGVALRETSGSCAAVGSCVAAGLLALKGKPRKLASIYPGAGGATSDARLELGARDLQTILPKRSRDDRRRLEMIDGGMRYNTSTID